MKVSMDTTRRSERGSRHINLWQKQVGRYHPPARPHVSTILLRLGVTVAAVYKTARRLKWYADTRRVSVRDQIALP